jgi:glucose/arabinose dehydrogenase
MSRTRLYALLFALGSLTTVDAQSPSPAVGVLDQPVVLRTAAATVKVSAIRGLVYPWALAFLPNGDILVTEQGRNTLRRISQGVLDPTPITGLPQGITSTRRDTAGVDIVVHPRFAENHFVYVAYWKPMPTPADRAIRTAVLLRARYDGGSTLQDVKQIFVRTR